MVSEQQLKPQFFVTRPNGSMIALIAMDELPPTINIRNVNLILSPHDISGMTGVGTYDTRHQTHIVEQPNPPVHFVDRSLTASRFPGPEHDRTSGFPRAGFQTPPKAFGIQEQAPITPDTNSNQVDRNAQPLPTWHDLAKHGLTHAPGTKEYCTYWLRHGECDFAQQGCLFKHEMPLDRAELDRIGLRDIPRWYREKHGISSYLAVGGGGSDGERKRQDIRSGNWRKDVGGKASVVPPAPPSTPRLPSRALVSGRRSKHTDISIPTSPPTATFNSGTVVETVRERQIKETIAQLNQYEAREARMKKQLTQRMERLEAGKHAVSGSIATNTDARPSSSHTSSMTSLSSKRGEAALTPGISASEDEVEYATASETRNQLKGNALIGRAKPALPQTIRSSPSVPQVQTKAKPKTSRRSKRRVAASSDDGSEGDKSGGREQMVQEPKALLDFYDHDD